MMKIVILGILAVGAMAEFPGFMGVLGDLDMANHPEGTAEMMENLKPEDIKRAVENMSPEMVDMMKEMGITEDQIKDTVSNMPKDFDTSSIMGDMSDKMKNGQEEIRNKMMEKISQMKDQVKEDSISEFKIQMEDMGIDLAGVRSGIKGQILPKLTEMLGKDLRNHGIDTDDTEQLRKDIHMELRMMIGAGKDETNDEIREKLAQKNKEEMKEDGIDFGKDNMKSGLMKELGLNMDGGFDRSSLKDMMKSVTKSGQFGHPDRMARGQFGHPHQMDQQFAAPMKDMMKSVKTSGQFGHPDRMAQQFAAPMKDMMKSVKKSDQFGHLHQMGQQFAAPMKDMMKSVKTSGQFGHPDRMAQQFASLMMDLD
jgi:hypothetical protein